MAPSGWARSVLAAAPKVQAGSEKASQKQSSTAGSTLIVMNSVAIIAAEP